MSVKRVVVISDTHGEFFILKKIVDKYMSQAHCFIHLGDGQKEVEDIKDIYPMLKFYAVQGNCDYLSDLPIYDEITVEGKRIVFTHGHHYGINFGFDKLMQFAKQKSADIILYGHLHVVCDNYIDEIHVISPGSPTKPRDGKPSFAIIDIGEHGVVTNFMDIKKLLY